MKKHPAKLGDLLQVARELRRRQTSAEEVLWALLRSRNLLGLKFRRQHQIGPFIADFFCNEARLVIEVDGGIHATEPQADRDDNRDVYLRQNHYLVLRFSNRQVLEDPESVLREIARATGRWWEQEEGRGRPSPWAGAEGGRERGRG